MKKLVKESLYESKITKSYDKKMTEEQLVDMVKNIRKRYEKQGPYIKSMTEWLSINNIGSYQYNMWVRAVIDTMFKNVGGSWVRINDALSDEEIAARAISFWHRKLQKRD